MKRVPLIAAIAVFAIHLFANPNYGYFRDELYFIICGFHPQWGYVDQPPVVPLLAAFTQSFGHSLLLLRAVPALFAGAGAYVTCELVAEFGGTAFAQGFAALVYFFTPVLMSFGMKVGPDEVGLLTWPLIALLFVKIARGADQRLWIAAGAVAGLSIESKYSVLFFLASIVIGTVLAAQRRILFSRWAAAGLGIAFLIALPNLLWQIHYDLPMLELLRNGQNGKNLIVTPPVYALQELIITNFLLSPVWIAGLVWLLWNRAYRFLGYTYLLLIALMLAFHGKHYYPADVYPILIAAGAVAIGGWAQRGVTARAAVVAYAVLAGLVFTPDTLPVLSEQQFIAYASARNAMLHVSNKATETEHGREDNLLPADWADMHGWPEMAQRAKAVYESLPPAERAHAVVFAGNYGEASAVEFFTPGVPVISEHNQYWLWGTRGYDGRTIVQINGSCFHSMGLFASRTRAATIRNRYAINYETNIPIWICRNAKKPLTEIWPQIKSYE